MTDSVASSMRDSIRETIAKLKAEEAAEIGISPLPIPPIPRLPNSGLYTYSRRIMHPQPLPVPTPVPIPVPGPGPVQVMESAAELGDVTAALAVGPVFSIEELRLDVDGYYPQMKASGMISGLKIAPAYWIANLTKTAANTYEGAVWYKSGNVGLIPFSTVKIEIIRTLFTPQSAKVTFSGGGVVTRVLVYKYKSRYFHKLNFEFDAAQGVNPVIIYNTGSHPNRPASLPVEALSIATVYRRAGFDVSITAGDTVPIGEAGADAKWSDAEMHDAMQIHWSKYADVAQWAMWVFFASLHESGTSLGGIMFDDIGPNHRQGTSLFLDSFIKNAPAADPAPAAWVKRMIFWTACHEMGHALNLAHSWQKELGVPWIPLVNEPLARSFMNYPYNVPGGATSFFSDFEFRFSDPEILFLRHAPYTYVEPGNADWFDHHGFQQAEVSPEPTFALRLECPQEKNTLEFLEPPMIHLVIENISDQPQIVGEKILASTENMTLIIKKRGSAARQFHPFAQRCWRENTTVMQPGATIKDSLFLVGRNGWNLAEPGYYTVQAAVRILNEDVVSQPITIRVAPPKEYIEEFLAQDFFSDDVGRVIEFDGSHYLDSANNVLREVVERLPQSMAAIHSKVALASPITSEYKQVRALGGSHTVKVFRAEQREAANLLSALVEDSDTASRTLGEVDYDYYCNRFNSILEESRTAMAR